MRSSIIEFKSGLRLAYMQRDSKSVGISILCGVGSENETIENNGISHFIEHMVFKGTKNRSAFQIANEIESIGAQINAFTSKQNTCYYTYSLSSEFEKCAEILSDILFNSTFDELEMDREKKVILEEISMTQDDNQDVSIENSFKAYFGDNSLGREILGPASNVKKFDKNDILNYMKENYIANNIVISVVGGVSLEKAKEIVLKYFEGKFASNKDRLWFDEKHLTKPNSLLSFKHIEQANISLAMPSYSMFDNNCYALSIVAELLGGGMSSRLFQELREKNGLVYSVFSTISAYCNNGVSSIYIGTNPKSIEKALTITAQEVNKARKEGFTLAEIEKGKKTLTSNYVFAQESTISMMRAIGKKVLFKNEMLDVDYEIEQYNSLSVDDIKKALFDCFDLSKASLGYAGQKTKLDMLNALN